MSKVLKAMNPKAIRSRFNAGMRHQKISSRPKARKSIRTFIKTNNIKTRLWK